MLTRSRGLALIAGLAAALAAVAMPSITGPTGSLVLPSSFVVAEGADLSIGIQNSKQGAMVDRSFPVHLVMRSGPGTEVGLSYEAYQGAPGSTNTWGAHVKSNLRPVGPFLVSSGTQYARIDKAAFAFAAADTVTAVQSYVVGTAPMTVNGERLVLLSLGASYTWLDLGAGVRQDGVRPFASLTVATRGPATWVLDLQGRSIRLGDAGSLKAIGVHYPVGDTAMAQIGFTNAASGFRAGDSMMPYVAVSYRLRSAISGRD